MKDGKPNHCHLRPPGRDVHHPEDHGQRYVELGKKKEWNSRARITVMTENVFAPHTETQAEPTLRRNLELQKVLAEEP